MCVLPSLRPHFTSLFFMSDRSLWYGLVRPFLWPAVESRTVPPPQTLDACVAVHFPLYPALDFASRPCGCLRVPTGLLAAWHRRLAAASGRWSLAHPFAHCPSSPNYFRHFPIPNPCMILSPARPSVRVTYPVSLPYQSLWHTIHSHITIIFLPPTPQ